MFFRLILADFKVCLRSKRFLFWMLFFPIGLGTLYYFAFSSIYSSVKSEPIQVAVEVTDNAIDEYKVMQAFSMYDTDKIKEDFEKYYTDKATAEAMGKDFNEEPPISEDDLEALESIKTFDDMKGFSLDFFDEEYLTGDVNSIDSSDLPLVKVFNELTYEDGTQMVEMIPFTNRADAEKLLKDGDITGIVTINSLSDIKLLVNGSGVGHSILSSIISEYLLQMDLTIDRINDNPGEKEDVSSAIEASTFNLDYIKVNNTEGDNKDPFISYFYNLITMICLMGSMSSLASVVNTQANQGPTGIRIDCSPVNKTFLELANLAAMTLIQIGLIIIGLSYLIFGLKLHFGGDVLIIYLTAMLSCTVGSALGFLVGHIGQFKQEIKEAILMAVYLGGGFLSGLMYSDMKIIIEENCPIINRLNPSAVITDAFLSLNLFGPGKQYYRSIIYIIIIDIIMLTVGLMLSRRKGYKSL
jgi:ABC-type multidrug transport system, permease component